MPWWILVALGLLGADRKRHALPYLTPAEHELKRQIDAFKRQTGDLNVAAAVKRRLDELRVELDRRFAALDKRHAAMKQRIAAIQASPTKFVPPDVLVEMRAIEREGVELEALQARYAEYVRGYEMQVDKALRQGR